MFVLHKTFFYRPHTLPDAVTTTVVAVVLAPNTGPVVDPTPLKTDAPPAPNVNPLVDPAANENPVGAVVFAAVAAMLGSAGVDADLIIEEEGGLALKEKTEEGVVTGVADLSCTDNTGDCNATELAALAPCSNRQMIHRNVKLIEPLLSTASVLTALVLLPTLRTPS